MLADSSALIPLARAGKLWLLKSMHRKIWITPAIEIETVSENRLGSSEIKKAIGNWITVVAGSKKTGKESATLALAENIAYADAELILLAEKNREEILTNDYRMAAVAKTKGVSTRWLTGFVLECTKRKILSKPDAKETLLELVKGGLHLSPEVFAEAQRLIEEI